MKRKLTDKQKEILNFIVEFVEENGYPPTYREIGNHFGIASTFGVKRHIDALVKKGFLNVESNSSRAMSIINRAVDEQSRENENYLEIPLVGRVAAGYPVLSEENIEGSIRIDKNFLRYSNDLFALRVRGESMINAGILEGDVVIVARNRNVGNGDIVVAMLDGEATLKRFLKKKNGIFLIPENENFSPIRVNKSSDFSIIGKIVGLFRNYN